MRILIFLTIFSLIKVSIEAEYFFSNFIHRDFRQPVTQIKDSYIFKNNDQIIYVASTNFVVIDRETQTIISRTNATNSSFTITGIEVSKDQKLVFLTYTLGGVFIYNIENLEIPTLESSIFPTHIVNDLKVDEMKKRIIAVGSGSLSVIDYSDLQNPVVQAKMSLKASRQDHIDLSKDGQYAFVTLYDRGFGIYNIQQLIAGDEIGALVYSRKMAQFSHDIAVSKDSKQLYVVDSYEGKKHAILQQKYTEFLFFSHFFVIGLFYFDISKILVQETLVDADVAQYPLDDAVMNFVYGITLSPDNRFIYYGMQGRGIFVYDIQNPKSKVILQELGCRVLPWELDISEDGKYLLVSGMTDLLVFKANPLHLQNQYMNFFNDLSSFRIDLPVLNGKPDNPNRVAVSPDQKVVIACYNTMGSYIIDIQNPLRPKLASFIPGSDSHDGVTFLQSQNIVLLAQSLSIMIYDVTDPYNIVLLSDFPAKILSTNKIDTDDVVFTQDQKYLALANGVPGMAVVNIEDLRNPIVTGWWYLLEPGGSSEKCAISNDGNRVYMVSRGQGFFIIDTTDKYNKNMTTIGWARVAFAYYPVINSQETLLFLAEQLEGVTIWNIEDKQNPVFIKRIQMDLMVAKMMVVEYTSAQYLLAPGWFLSTLNIVNITDPDPMNHHVILKYGDLNQDAPDVQITQGAQFAVAAVSNQGFRIWPIYPIVQITSEIIMLRENEQLQMTSINIEPTAALQVGISYQIYLNFYSVKSKAKIVDVQVYNDQFTLVPLPAWIIFQSDSQLLAIDVNKEVVNINRKYSYLTLLLTVKTQLTRLSFIDEELNINFVQSDEILKTLRAYSFVDDQDYLNTLTDPDGYIPDFAPTPNVPDYNDDKIKTQIREVLKYSKTRVPLIFWVVNSLKFNITSPQNLISSPSKTASIKVQFFNSSQVSFVRRKISGATIIFDDENNKFIQVIGDLNVLQGMFKNQIKYFLKADNTTHLTVDQSNISLSIVVDDFKNERIIIQNSTLSDCVFLNEIPKLAILVPIHMQFSQFFPDNQVYMNQDFSFQFSESTFQTLEGLTIEYRGYYKEPKSDNWIEFGTTKFWLSFNNKDRNLFGQPPQSSFGDTIEIKITASDSYFTAEQYFQLSVLKIVFSDLIVYMAMAFSGVTALYTFIRYRYIFYNFICKQKFTTENLEAYSGSNFSVCIPLIKDDMEIAKSIFDEIIQFPQLSRDSMLTADGDLNQQAIIQLINSTNQKRDMFELGLEGEIKDPGFQRTQILKNITNVQGEGLYQNEIHLFPDIQKSNVQMMQTPPHQQMQFMHELANSQQSNDSSPRKRKSTIGPQKPEITLEDKNRRETLKNLKKQKVQLSLELEGELLQLLDQTNEAVYTPVVQKFIFHIVALWAKKQKINSQTNQTFQLLKKECQQERKFPNKQNWVCQFCIFDNSKFDYQSQFQISYIPEIKVDEEKLKQKMEDLKIPIGNCNIRLILKIIQAKALGISKHIRSEINGSKGISICISHHNLQDVKAFEKISHSLLLTSFGMDHKEISMGQLPPWLECEIKSKTFHLFGKPEQIDKGSILIKMINRSNMSIRAFSIDVQVNKQQKDEQTQLIRNPMEVDLEDINSQLEIPFEKIISPASLTNRSDFKFLQDQQ